MSDVIACSTQLHPTLNADALRAVVRVHGDYASVTHDREAGRIARGMAAQLTDLAMLLKGEEVEVCCSFGLRVIAFDVAARLQCLSPGVRQAIAQREAGCEQPA